MLSITVTISKSILQNIFVKEIMPVLSKILGKVILNSLLLAYLVMLNILLIPNTNFKFPIIILSISLMYFELIIQILSKF